MTGVEWGGIEEKERYNVEGSDMGVGGCKVCKVLVLVRCAKQSRTVSRAWSTLKQLGLGLM